MSVGFGTNVNVQKRRVKFYNRESSAVTLYEGMPVCYMFDTTVNVLGYDKGAGGLPACQTSPSSTAEGNQNEGKFMIVETVNDDNHLWFAGVLAGAKMGKSVAATSYEWVEIYEPNGAIVPVRVDIDTTVGRTILALEHDSQALTVPLNTSEGRPVAIAEESVSGGTSARLCLAKLCPQEFIYQDHNGTALNIPDDATAAVVINRINLTTAQTGGRFTAFDLRSTITGTPASTGYGFTLYTQTDISGIPTGQNAGISHWTNINAGGDYASSYYGMEIGIYEGGADLSGISGSDVLSPLCLRVQLDSTDGCGSGTTWMMYFRSDGAGDQPDGIFCAYDSESIGGAAQSGASVSHVIPIKVEAGGGAMAAGTYYIMVSDTA